MTPLSIVYITLNAEKHLSTSLKQAKRLTHDVLIVDSGSTDNTHSIAHDLDVKVITNPWPGFAAQKQFAIEAAEYDWVLFLDADEVLTDIAIDKIQQVLSDTNLSQHAAFSLRRKNYFHGKWIQHGSWWPDRVVRLIDRRQGQMKPVKVHEHWQCSADKTVKLEVDIEHYSYENYAEMIEKANRYSTLAAEALFKEGKQTTKWAPLNHGLAAFVRLFLLKRGFKDGIEGAAIAGTAALASFMKYAKLQELHQQSKAACQIDSAERDK